MRRSAVSSGGSWQTHGDLLVREVRYHAGATQLRHAHAESSVSLVLAGELEESSGNTNYVARAGSVVFKPAGWRHANTYGPRGAAHCATDGPLGRHALPAADAQLCLARCAASRPAHHRVAQRRTPRRGSGRTRPVGCAGPGRRRRWHSARQPSPVVVAGRHRLARRQRRAPCFRGSHRAQRRRASGASGARLPPATRLLRPRLSSPAPRAHCVAHAGA